MLHPLDGSSFDLIKAAYGWLSESHSWPACLGWNLGIAGLLAFDRHVVLGGEEDPKITKGPGKPGPFVH